MKRTNLKIITAIFILSSGLIPVFSLAEGTSTVKSQQANLSESSYQLGASLYIAPLSENPRAGGNFTVTIKTDSLAQPVNAIKGVLTFNKDRLEIIGVSKIGSILNLWVDEPSFSNLDGTLKFQGGVPNPGFMGNGGVVLHIIFRAKTSGVTSLIWKEGQVLASDGKGTNILTSMGSGSYVIQTGEYVSPPTYVPSQNTPTAPIISSPTHPDSEKWYSNNDPKFNWEVPEWTTGVRLLVDHQPVVTPTVFYSEPITENWWPVQIYCEKCMRDTTKILDWDGNFTLEYECKCTHHAKVDFSKPEPLDC